LVARVPAGCTVLVSTSRPPPSQTHAGDRDATLLRSQLEPWSTPTLRRRLAVEFGINTEPEHADREAVFELLLEAYAARGPRSVRRLCGIAPPTPARPLLAALLNELRHTTFPQGAQRERQTVQAEGYIILQRPAESHNGSQKARLAAAKLKQHARAWELAHALLKSVDPDYAELYSAIAMTKQFVGSPHIDTENIGPFYGLALGNFDGGQICVESTPFEVVEMDTHNRIGKIDGRFPHWVAPHTGERYSVIYYQTAGTVMPKSAAAFS